MPMYVVTWTGMTGQTYASQPLTEAESDNLLDNLVAECAAEVHEFSPVEADMLTVPEWRN